MLDVLRNELAQHGAFNEPSHVFVEALTRTIPFSTVPKKMKIIFALSHLSQYSAQFKRNIQIWDGAEVPTNNISFVIADSGANKDSSNSKVKKCFKRGYNRIHEFVSATVTEDAIEAATRAGEDTPEEYVIYREYMKPIPPVFMTFTTAPGLVQHINDIGDLPALAGAIYTGELSDELAHNPHALENIKVISEVFDTGDKEATYTKGVEFRSKEISGQSVSALLVSSPGHILYDEATKKKFHIAFMSKLARRSWFTYNPERIYEPDFSTEDDPIAAMEEYIESIDSSAAEAIDVLQDEIDVLTDYNLDRVGEPITTDPEVYRLYNIYRRYNREVVDQSNSHESLYALVRAHLQWKALKLAGALAIIEQEDVITPEHFITAIQYCEMFDTDITHFEKDVNKAPHERLADYLKSTKTSNQNLITVHDIKKHGFSSTVSPTKLQEMVSLCAGYDPLGVYSIADQNSGIQYEAVTLTEEVLCSYKEFDGSVLEAALEAGDKASLTRVKQSIASSANTGLSKTIGTFAELRELLEGDFVYSPFEYVDGIRGRNNIVGGTKWLVFDIDETGLSFEDAHFILEGINHHIALTSNPNNYYKYRVLVELDAVVELPASAWKYFYTAIGEELGLSIDVLPQSQLFFSYAGREIRSNLDGTPIVTRDHVMEAKARDGEHIEKTKKLTSVQRNSLLDNPFETFWYAFEAERGRRSVALYRALKHAQELGADLEYTLDLLSQINEYLVQPLEEDRYQKLVDQAITIFNQMES